jgi:hypothetical protein
MLRKLPLFVPFADLDKSDLEQEALMALSTAAGSFDSEAASWTTFAYQVAARRLIDIWRVRSRELGRQHKVARSPAVSDADQNAPDLADWCADVRRLAREAYGSKVVKLGRKFYRVDRVAGVVMLGHRLALGPDALRWLLGRRRDLLEALGFLHVPGRRLFEDAAELLDRMNRRGGKPPQLREGHAADPC